MGTIQHHAILVTGMEEHVSQARDIALSIFPDEQVSLVSGPVTNHFCSFAVFPDGSKEWWPESDRGNEQREKFISWLKEYLWVSWVEVGYGELGYDTRHG